MGGECGVCNGPLGDRYYEIMGDDCGPVCFSCAGRDDEIASLKAQLLVMRKALKAAKVLVHHSAPVHDRAHALIDAALSLAKKEP